MAPCAAVGTIVPIEIQDRVDRLHGEASAEGFAVDERKVLTRSPLNVRGRFNSIKCGHSMPWETPLERDAMLILEFDRHVTTFKHHQRRVHVEGENGGFDTFPDIEYARDGLPGIIEVKRDVDLHDPRLVRRLSDVRRHFLIEGIDYQVWSTSRIRQEPQLTNLKELNYHRYRGGSAYLRQIPALTNLLMRDHLTLGELAETIGGWWGALTAVANDLFTVDLTQPLTPASIALPAGAPHATV